MCDRDALYVKSQIVCAEIEMNAMIAENKQREIEGKSMAFTEEHFMKLLEQYEINHNAVYSRLWHKI